MTQRRARWVVTAHLAAIYVLSNLPTPLYPLYQRAFGFSRVMLSVIYATYVVGSIAVLFVLGRLSDQIGRRRVVLAGTACALAAGVLFLATTSTAWLFAARVVSGVGIALVTGASTAWLLELGNDAQAATRLTLAGSLIGLAAGPMLAGCLARWAPAPRTLCYVAFLVILVPLALVVARAPETVDDRKPLREVSVTPRIGVPKDLRRTFLPAALGAFAVFSVLGFYSALAPSLLADVLHIHDVAVSGSVVAEGFVACAFTAALPGALDLKRALIVALALFVPGLALLVATQLAHSFVLLLIGTAVIGGTAGLGYRACFQLVNEMAPEDARAELVSAFVIVCYVAISLPVIGASALAAGIGFMAAAIAFACLMAAIAIAALIAETQLAD